MSWIEIEKLPNPEDPKFREKIDKRYKSICGFGKSFSSVPDYTMRDIYLSAIKWYIEQVKKENTY